MRNKKVYLSYTPTAAVVVVNINPHFLYLVILGTKVIIYNLL